MRLLPFLNSSSLFVALGAACTCAHAYLICDYSIPIMEVALVFFLTWCAYLFLNPTNSKFHKIRITIAVTASVLCLLFVDARYILLCCLALPLVLFYNTKWLSEIWKDKIFFSFRNNGWSKIFVTSLAWCIITTCPLFIDGEINFWSKHAQILYSNFFLILALVMAGDIRDVTIDPPKLQTVPLLLGTATTRDLCAFAIIISTIIGGFACYQYSPLMLYAFIATQVFTLVFIWPFAFKQSWQYYTFMLDGLLVMRFAVAFACALLIDRPPV